MLRISLKAARVNANLSQKEVAKILSVKLGTDVTRQRIAYFESNPGETPVKYATALSDLYHIPSDNIFFNKESTLSYSLPVKQKAEVV